jgi:hypothetical protein
MSYPDHTHRRMVSDERRARAAWMTSSIVSCRVPGVTAMASYYYYIVFT